MASSFSQVILLGHNGFIGKRLQVALTRVLEGKAAGGIKGFSLPDFDLTQPESVKSLQELFDSNVAVVMCSGIKRDAGDTIESFRGNVAMVENVCKALKEKPVSRFIFLSSAAVYGEDVENLAISEETVVCPKTFYGIAKFTCERLLNKVFSDLGSSSLVLLRPPTLYGPGEPILTYSPSGFINRVYRELPITLWGDGSERREFVYVDDVAEVISELLQNDFSGVLNVVSGESYTFSGALNLIEAALGRKIPYAIRERSKDKVDNGFDNRLMRKTLPKFKFTNLRDGVRKTIESLQ